MVLTRRGLLKIWYKKLNQAISRPPIPSDPDKKALIQLESLRVSNPVAADYDVEGRKPHVCGVLPERVAIEVRVRKSRTALTYWYYWSYDRFPGDHENWEPVTLVYSSNALIEVYARVHDGLVHFTPNRGLARQTIFFAPIGHTPIINIEDPTRDFTLQPVKDGLDKLREKWLLQQCQEQRLEHCSTEPARRDWPT